MCRVAVSTESLQGASDATLYCCFGPSAISKYYNSCDFLQPLHQKMLSACFQEDNCADFLTCLSVPVRYELKKRMIGWILYVV